MPWSLLSSESWGEKLGSTGLGDDKTPKLSLLWVCSLTWGSQRHPSTPDLIASQNEIEGHHRDFPGGPVVKNVPSNAGDASLIPGQGSKIPHAERPRSLSATTERSLTLAQQKIPMGWDSDPMQPKKRASQYGQRSSPEKDSRSSKCRRGG